VAAVAFSGQGPAGSFAYGILGKYHQAFLEGIAYSPSHTTSPIEVHWNLGVSRVGTLSSELRPNEITG
jgi:hypothetical protein